VLGFRAPRSSLVESIGMGVPDVLAYSAFSLLVERVARLAVRSMGFRAARALRTAGPRGCLELRPGDSCRSDHQPVPRGIYFRVLPWTRSVRPRAGASRRALLAYCHPYLLLPTPAPFPERPGSPRPWESTAAVEQPPRRMF